MVPLEGDALLLEAESEWAEAICAVLDQKGVRVKEMCKQPTAERLIA